MENNQPYPPKRRFFFLLFPLMILGLSAIVMLLWNALLPQILHTEYINYWQALGLLVLSRILFGGFRFGPGRHFGPPAHMRKKWMEMSDEERARFKDEWRRRCGERRE